jgi:hypothetical protein
MAELRGPQHLVLRRYRVVPDYFEDFVNALQVASDKSFSALEEFASQKTELLHGIYDEGFADGYAAALLEVENND